MLCSTWLMRYKASAVSKAVAGAISVSVLSACGSDSASSAVAVRHSTIIFVWDGLRPDSVTQADTPNLLMLRQAGVNFSDNHSTYPTFTMMNAASLATGGFPGTTGFYGNTLWQEGPTGSNSAGAAVDFTQPVFTEDYGILQDLDAYYNGQLLSVGTLFQAAQAAGLKTVAVGKSGPAFLQDRKKGGIILDEKTVFPLSLVGELQTAGYAIPKTTPFAYPAGQVTLAVSNGDPTASPATVKMADKVTADPTDTTGSPPAAANAYMMNAYLNYILPNKKPDLSLVWFRNPDSTEHPYGPGTANYHDALKQQDKLLGQLQAKLVLLGLDKTTNIIVMSDHGHSSVSGPALLFPLRTVANGTPGAIDTSNGYSVSGDVRLADLFARAGLTAYDGSGCILSPILSGIKADGSQVYPTQTDLDGTVCGTPNVKYTTASFKVPATLPPKALVVAANGGSDYVYVPDHDHSTVQAAVKLLQSREEIGAVFVASRYGSIVGTIPLSTIRVENAGRGPDIVASYTSDETASVAGMPGIEFESMQINRGMHGSFGSTDVHNTLLASGPDFATGMTDTLPSGNVDVAPTVATLLKLQLPQADGRPLLEALTTADALKTTSYSVAQTVVNSSSPATGMKFAFPTNPNGIDIDTGKSTYAVALTTKQLTVSGKAYTYFDSAKAVRQ